MRLFADTTPLRSPDFRRLWLAGIPTVIGANLTIFAVPVQIYALTENSAYVGLAGLFALVPLIVFGLLGGAWADAMDRRILLIIASSGLALSSVLLWVQAAAALDNVWAVLGVLAVQQAFYAVNAPTRSAAIPRMLAGGELPAANSLNMTVFQFGAIVGPLLAGLLLNWVDLSTLYLIDAVACLVPIWATVRLTPMPAVKPAAALAGAEPSRWGVAAVLGGLRYLAGNQVVLMSFVVDLIAMILGMPRSLFPQIAYASFGGPVDGGTTMALLAAAMSAGAVVGGVFSGWLPRIRRQGLAIVVAIVMWGAAMVGFGLAVLRADGRPGPALWVSLVFLAVGGAADMVSAAFRSTILQQVASDDVRGRLQGVFTVVVAGGPRLADALHGAAGAAIGTAAAAAGGGALVVVGVLVAALTVPAFIRYARPNPGRPTADSPDRRPGGTHCPDTDYLELCNPYYRVTRSKKRKGVLVATTDDTATLRYPGGDVELPIVHATEGSDGIDIGSLLAKTGYTTFDNGYANTAPVKSAITYIDGDAGILRYRGYPIEQLAEKSTFIEVSYLLIYGELPTAKQLADFTRRIQRHTMLHEDLKRFFDGFPRNAHPMPVVSSAVNALSAYYQDSLDPSDNGQVEVSTIRLLGKLSTIAAYAYKKSVGQPFLYPDNSHTLVENFLRMTFGLPAEPYVPDPEVVRALDMLFILHADHEQNCSTSTVRLVGSSNANLFTSISGGINALWGPRHGGANQAVLEMLETIRDEHGNVTDFVRRVKNREEGVKLMGFGHRVYRNYDPRARIVKEQADKVLDKLGGDDELLGIAKDLEEAALTDEYFIERKLYPNVDFYTGLIYRAMGFPTRMFTVLFALGRLPGWIAHWREMHDEGDSKIGRPRQIYTGYGARDYTANNTR